MKAKTQKKPAATEPARKKRGALMVYEQLREDIQWLRIDPGSALDEVALARSYEVSRTPVREALLLLSNEGFVQFLQNRTTIVAPLTMQNQAAFLDTFILLSRGLVRAAALNGPSRPDVLGPHLAAYEEGLSKGDPEQAFLAQLALYRAIAEQTQNRFLGKYFLEAQDASVRTKLIYFFPHVDKAVAEEALRLLRAVVDAMLAGDGEAADSAVRASILFEAQVIQNGLGPRYGHHMALDLGGTA